MAFISFPVLLIIVFYNAVHHVKGAGEYTYFQEITDRRQVEQKAISYAEYKKSPTAKVTELMPRLRKSIIHSTPEEKITFCKRILRVGYYGFKLDLNQVEVEKWVENRFSTRHDTETHKNHFELSMFACPPMYYIDLETEEKTFLPYMYYVSKASELLSACVFFQEAVGAPIYPHIFVSNIDFDKLMASLSKRKDRPTKPEYSNVSVQDRLMEYLHATQIEAPYRKFKETYFSLNICGLPRSHKIYLCRQNVDRFSNHLTLDVHDYSEHECRRRLVRISPISGIKILVLFCPPAIFAQNPEETLPTRYYLSSNLNANSMMILNRVNRKRGVLEAKWNAIGLDTRPLYKDLRRKKFMLYPLESQQNQPVPQKRWKDIENELNSAEGCSVQTPTTIAKIDRIRLNAIPFLASSLQLIRDRWVQDEFVILFSIITKTTLVYKRFIQMYWSIDVCQLSYLQIEQLCSDILTGPEYGLQMNGYRPDEQLNYQCTRQTIRLTSREAENLETERFLMWQCPQPKNRPQVDFYVGKSHVKDTAILYRSTENPRMNRPLNFIYPDAVVIKINRDRLAKVAL